jgi:dihydroorotate dehydrogenase (NAD+) catalytic subunit
MNDSVALRTQIAPRHPTGLLLGNPVMTASGTFGYGTEYEELVDIQKLGAVVCKGITLLSRKGNPQPRIVETSSGLLNSIGLENIGVDALIAEKAPIWSGWQVPVIVNVAGETLDDYVSVVDRLEGVSGISGIELNVSCPNISAGAIEFGTSAGLVTELVAEVKAASSLPIIVKLSPNVTDIREIALAVESAGADAVSLINTVRGMSIDIDRRRPRLGYVTGGLSGPAVKPIALYMVYQVAKVVHIPLVGCGGISSSADALEFIMAGASAVEVGTANLADPRAPLDILQGIEDFVRKEQIDDLSCLVGIAHRGLQ